MRFRSSTSTVESAFFLTMDRAVIIITTLAMLALFAMMVIYAPVCPNCGKYERVYDKYCPECGQQLRIINTK